MVQLIDTTEMIDAGYRIVSAKMNADSLTDSAWQGATWSLPAGRAVNTPTTTGNELTTDGGLEDWTNSTTLASWTKGLAGTSTVNQEGTEKRTGSYCARMDIDGSNSTCRIYQDCGLTTGDMIIAKAYAKTSSEGKTGQIRSSVTSLTIVSAALTTSYALLSGTRIMRATESGIEFARNSAASSSLYVDDISVFRLSKPTLMRYIQFSTQYFSTCKAGWTVGIGLQAGIVCNLDSITNPQNFVFAVHDGANAQLWKCVAGTYTKLVDASATYGADRLVEIRRPSGNTYQLFYHGSQVGTDQTISDATVIDNKLHGLFSTGDGNSAANFTFTGA